MIRWLRDAEWLTQRRLQLYGLTFFGFYLALFVYAIVTATGVTSFTGEPVGTDFSQVWVAGRSVLAGDPALPFDPAQHALAQRLAFGPTGLFYGWHYPPYFLFVATAAALMPYLLSLIVWQATTLAFYAATIRRILPGRTGVICAIGYPAVFINLGHGHNGFLSAALLGSAVLALPRRPIVAGALFALVAYKPQFGLVVPVALIAGGYWRVIASAAATLAVMTTGTILAFGTGVWVAFAQSLAFTRVVVLEAGGTGWGKIQSVFSTVRMWGGDVDTAYAVQATVTCLVLVALFVVWRRQADLRLRGAALLAASLLTTPYCLDYDMMIIGPALALTVSYRLARGFAPWEKSALVAVWAAPMVARLAGQTLLLPVGLAAIAAMFCIAVRIALKDGSRPAFRLMPQRAGLAGGVRP